MDERAPEGVIALLFTDVEGSSRVATALGDRWSAVLADHHALVDGAIVAEGGFVDRTEGDAFFATFREGEAAARAAVAALRALRAHAWPAEVGELRARMGLHVGQVKREVLASGRSEYVGLEVHRAARVAAAAHGGQLLMTAAAARTSGRVVVAEPLGLHRLKDFPAPEALFCAVVDDRGPEAFPPPRTPAFRPNNLPAGRVDLVGRDCDHALVRDAFLRDGCRLVTVLGAGGVGKSSLALTVGSELLDEHPGGVWVVSLATLGSAADIMQEIANAFGARHDVSVSAFDAVVSWAWDRGAMLLILDNLEHLLAVTPELGRLLDALPDVRVLVTSRAPLQLAGERRVVLNGLAVDPALAVIERELARRGSDVSILDAERGALVEVVELLGGNPLALELAASRLRVLTPARLRDRLRRSIDLLKADGGDSEGRHRSLRATIEWTLSLLEPGPRELFTRLGVFAGPVEVDELERVADGDGLDVLDGLERLLDVALVRRVESGDGRVLFGLPEVLRQVAVGMLESSEDAELWRTTHAERQLEIAWAARATGDARWSDYSAAVAADAEAAAALAWATRTGAPVGRPLAAARAALLVDLGRVHEAFALVEPLLGSPSTDHLTEAQLHHSHAYALLSSRRYDEAYAEVEVALGLAPDAKTRAKALMLRGLIKLNRGEITDAVRDSEQATALARSVDLALHSGLLVMEAQTHMHAGELDRAAAQLDEAERLSHSVDTVRLRGRFAFRAELELFAGRPRAACEWLVRAFDAAVLRGSDSHLLNDLESLASALVAVDRHPDALEVLGLIEAQAVDVHGPDVDIEAIRRELPTVVDAERQAGADGEIRKAHGRSVERGMRATRARVLAYAASASGNPRGAWQNTAIGV